MLKTSLIAAASLASFVAAVPATAQTVINFNGNANNTYFVPSASSNGFVATENVNESGATPMGTNVAIDGEGPSNGTVHLDSWTNDGSHSIWTLTQANGNAFSLNAFDYATFTYYLGDAATALTLTGTLLGGGTVSQTFAPLAGAFQTFSVLPTFTGVTSVRFDAAGFHNRSAYDNIVVNATAAVPEPASWALMILGFGVTGFALRRRSAGAPRVAYAA